MHVDRKRIRVIRYQKEHYEEIKDFYTGHGWKQSPREIALPDMGFIVEDEDGLKLAVGFVYTSNSIINWLEWTATNPKAPLRIRHSALKLLVKTVQGVVKLRDPNGEILQATPVPAIIRFYLKLGFQVTENATLLHWGPGEI
jgi:hypothetical protein